MEDSAIKAGFDSLKPGSDFNKLREAALCRERADWLVGISATRLFTVLYGGATLNVGRVQSPTLAMLVRRESIIDNFAKELFYTIEISNGDFTALSKRFNDKAEAERIMKLCSIATVKEVRHTEKFISTPKLYDLTTLQREANRVYGFTAQQTLDYIQSLYEKKLSTYPRTDSRYLTDDMAASVTSVVIALAPKAPCDVLQVINSKKVSDHHAIIPTKEINNADFSALPSGERDLLGMIINRLLCAVGEKHCYLETIVTLTAGDVNFTAKGKTVLHDGWKAMAKAIIDDEDTETQTIGNISEGQNFPVTVSIKEGETTPPKHFTEDTLLSAMENADSDEFLEGTERKGLGTPATRAAIIEKLVKSSFVERSKKNMLPTVKGKTLIALLPDVLTSAKLTAEWENKLQEIEKDEYDANAFMRDIEDFITTIVHDNNSPKPKFATLFTNTQKTTKSLGKCPRCCGDVTEWDKGFSCVNSKTCGFKLWKQSKFWTTKKKALTATIVSSLLKDGRVTVKGLFSEKIRKKYDAIVILDDSGGQFINFKLEFRK